MEPEKADTAPAKGKYQKIERCLGRFVWKLAVWLVICLPIAFILIEVIGTLHFYRYPKITLWTILFFCLALLPTVCILITRKLKLRRVTKSIIGKLCALYLPISFFAPACALVAPKRRIFAITDSWMRNVSQTVRRFFRRCSPRGRIVLSVKRSQTAI